ncbi:MAG: hypothetical protein Q4C49_00650 [Bacillota bacterium]|nr:hypothetical protein [Bacillota bacterium]
MWIALSRYLTGNWSYIENPDLESFGIITMYNEESKSYDFLVLVSDAANM